MFTRFVSLLVFTTAPLLCADWNPRLAADYLDARQKAWFAWPAANASGMVCVSCHTGMPYLLARPALRRALGESSPTLYERGLRDGMKARVAKTDLKQLYPKSKGPHASEALGVEAIFSALFLAMDDGQRDKLNADAEKAFERMWSLQLQSGKAAGAWDWNSYDLDPWETPDGAALAALATGIAPGNYQGRPEIRQNLAALTTYLRSEQPSQPLHNRLIVLWASTKLRDLLTDTKRAALLDEVWGKQQADGGWTLESLGSWKKRPGAPSSPGSNGYATGLVAFVVQQAAVGRTNPRLVRALDWLSAHQDHQIGDWQANSMNTEREPYSMPAQFMQDAATGFATLALLEAGRGGTE